MQNELTSQFIDLGSTFYQKSTRFLELVGEAYYETGETYSITDLILETAGFKRGVGWDNYFSQLEAIFNGKMEKAEFLNLIQSIDLDPQETFCKIIRITKHLRNKERNLERLFERELLYVSDIQWNLEDIALKIMGIDEYPDDWEVLNNFYDGEIDIQQVLEEVQKIK